MPNSDITLDAVWTVTGTTYTVKHYKQNLDQTWYDLEDTEVLDGITESMTAAASKGYYWFTVQGFEQQTIKWDGSTIVEVYYNRNSYEVNFVNGDGTPLQSSNVLYEDRPSYNWAKPVKESTVQTWYTFTGWTDGEHEYASWATLPIVTTWITYTAIYSEYLRQYDVTFVNYDGTVLAWPTKYYYGTASGNIVRPANPTRPADVQYKYVFSRWTPEVSEVVWDVVYVAEYTSTLREYLVTFLNDNDQFLISKLFEYGTTPEYTWPSISKTGYVFDGWTPALSPVVDDATYRVVWAPSTWTEYTVQHLYQNLDGTGYDLDGTQTEVLHGTTWQPTNADSAKKSPIWFTGLDVEEWTIAADGSTIVNIYYDRIEYPIIFKSEWETLATYILKYGATPNYTWAEPTKPATKQYTYSFNWWYPEVGVVTTWETYVAQFSGTVNEYTVKFIDGDGHELKSELLSYWSVPSYTWDAPSKEATAQYTYSFIGWDPAIAAVTDDVTYIAQFTWIVNKYDVRFVDWDDTEISSASYDYGTPAGSIVKPANPSRASTEKYNYSFIKWEPTVSEVTKNVTYTALYAPILRNYQVKFVDENDNILNSQVLFYGELPVYKWSNPEKVWYTFTGWDPEIAMVAWDQKQIHEQNMK